MITYMVNHIWSSIYDCDSSHIRSNFLFVYDESYMIKWNDRIPNHI